MWYAIVFFSFRYCSPFSHSLFNFSFFFFSALVHACRPDLINYESLSSEDPATNFETAFAAAEKLGVPRLLDVEDMLLLEVPDRMCVMTYVSTLYKGLKPHYGF